MKNLKKLSKQNLESITGGALVICLLPNGGSALCPDYCPLEICNAVPARCLITDDSCW
ncbi:bacteriocin-like protein [Chryseobacterium tongliaoense]|uniref:bacteriocin-like protein n=1 Tax=Chryseobacterium tongliaoense TaxID=3240933 RepID=UPI003514C7F0